MEYTDIKTKLATSGLPVVQNFWEIGTVPSLPYLVFTLPDNNDFIADNGIYAEVVSLEVELYTNRKSISTEQTVEAVLKQHFPPYRKSSSWINSEKMQQTIYEMEVLITNG